jgi:hypothetical protein
MKKAQVDARRTIERNCLNKELISIKKIFGTKSISSPSGPHFTCPEIQQSPSQARGYARLEKSPQLRNPVLRQEKKEKRKKERRKKLTRAKNERSARPQPAGRHTWENGGRENSSTKRSQLPMHVRLLPRRPLASSPLAFGVRGPSPPAPRGATKVRTSGRALGLRFHDFNMKERGEVCATFSNVTPKTYLSK